MQNYLFSCLCYVFFLKYHWQNRMRGYYGTKNVKRLHRYRATCLWSSYAYSAFLRNSSLQNRFRFSSLTIDPAASPRFVAIEGNLLKEGYLLDSFQPQKLKDTKVFPVPEWLCDRVAEQSRKLKKGRTAMLKIVFGLGAGCLILAIGKINKAG